MGKIIFADYVVKENEIRRNDFECAAWYEEIELTPGEYPISAELDAQDEISDSVHFNIVGTIRSDYFQAMWCGQRLGEAYDTRKNAGKPAQWRAFFYAYAIAARIFDGTETHVRLRPGFEARRIDFDWKGKPQHTYVIARKEEN